mmetsp:Transcript_47185/g.109115  ORF Transcript_47185/g.109115 Transcript_47185/m.109115 type:complete len:414 (-) Transcript_47185:103-1344(-)
MVANGSPAQDRRRGAALLPLGLLAGTLLGSWSLAFTGPAAPATSQTTAVTGVTDVAFGTATDALVAGVMPGSLRQLPPARRSGSIARRAVLERVLGAVSAGLVASVVSAMLAAITEPVMNRVLVKRMSIKDAISEMSPKLVLKFFTTTMSTNLLKFPLFEAVAMFLSLLPNMSNVVRGIIVGFVFTTATLPITNFRYRMSIQTPMQEALNPKLLYQAYPATVVRDMVYAIARNILTAVLLARFTGLEPASAALMFPVVIGACVLSAPFNELRGYLLQSASKKLPFSEFFKPANFVRSTSLGALNMGVSVATGYYLTPIVTRQVRHLAASLEAGDPWVLIKVVLLMDVMGIVAAQAFSKTVYSRAIDENKENAADKEEEDRMDELMKRMEALEATNKQLASKVVSLGGKVEEEP